MNVVSCNIFGGLGNTLFQIATGYSIAIDENSNFIVDKTSHYNGHRSFNVYENTIFRKIKFSDTPINYEIYNVAVFHYQQIPKFLKNIKISGFFQSEKYFKHNKEKILHLYEPDENTINTIAINYNKLLENKTCSLHVRRGDYLHLKDFHPVLPIEYYKKAYEIVGSDYTYLIFSDDIQYCESQFEFIKNKIYIKDLEDYQQLYLMSLCDCNIIANSTFSWWGAWMNKNKKIVVSPKNWFGKSLQSYIIEDLYPDNWIKI